MRTTASWWLLRMAETFRWMGLPVASLFEQANIPIASLAQAEIRLPQDNVTRLWKAAFDATNNEAIGLSVGQTISLSSSPTLAPGLLECSSAHSGIQLILRYQKLIGEVSNIEVLEYTEDDSDTVTYQVNFRFYDDQVPLTPHTIDASMASIVQLARFIEGPSWNPKKICLSRDVKSPEAHQQYFRCELAFNQKDNQIFFVSDEKSIGKKLYSLNENKANTPPKKLADMISAVLPELLQTGEFGRKHIAKLMDMSERTLQRRLSNEGIHFSDILDDIRKQRSEHFMENTDLSQTEIAFLCGFGDLSAFHHAFKRWFDASPGDFRKQLLERNDKKSTQ